MWENMLSRKCENFCPWDFFFFSVRSKYLCIHKLSCACRWLCRMIFMCGQCKASLWRRVFCGGSRRDSLGAFSSTGVYSLSSPRSAQYHLIVAPRGLQALFPGQVPHAPQPSRGPGRLSSKTPGSLDGRVWVPPQTWLLTASPFVSLVADQQLPAWACILCVPRATVRLRNDSCTSLQQVQRGPPCLLALLFEIIVTFYMNPFFPEYPKRLFYS